VLSPAAPRHGSRARSLTRSEKTQGNEDVCTTGTSSLRAIERATDVGMEALTPDLSRAVES